MSLFDTSILGVKIVLALLLFILSFVNAYTPFVTKYPRKFIGEMVLVGAMSALAFGFIAAFRQVPAMKTASVMFLSFLIFALFHVVMEFSGGNQLSVDSSQVSGKIKTQQKVFTSRPSLIILGIIAALILGLALYQRDFQYVSGLQVLFEAGVFGFLNAVPSIMITIDRGDKNPSRVILGFLKMFGLFFCGHIVLQSGGFYTSVFEE